MAYRIKLHCLDCGHVYTRTLNRLDAKNPRCPKCNKREKKARGIDFESGKAPAAIGQNISVKAIDETANIVMQDFKMTDLKTDVRQGESMAPKLAPQLQSMADGFFGGKAASNLKINAGMRARQALAGSFRPQAGNANNPDVVATMHGHKEKMAVQLFDRKETK